VPFARKRIIVSKPGSYEVLRYDALPIEDPRAGEVQVETRACGINFADTIVRRGLYAAAGGKYPICPGFEFAGTVRRVGKGVRAFTSGDRVFGVSRFGGYTTAINATPAHLWKLPDHWDFIRGAAFPVAYLTAYYALYHVGHLRKEDLVLVHSAAGGVGTAILHLLKINGNTSVGVVGRAGKVSAAREAGAKFVIDKSTHNLWAEAEALSPEGYDMILDANGASTLKGSYDHIGPTGRLLVYGFASMLSHSGRKNYLKLLWTYLHTPRFNPLDLTGSNKTISGFNLVYLFEKAELFRKSVDALLAWDAKDLIPPMPITRFPFEDAVGAHKVIESGKSVGKLVLMVEEDG
jgi:NADPH:quinone reductase-like Zn-dependent oxidoreductase